MQRHGYTRPNRNIGFMAILLILVLISAVVEFITDNIQTQRKEMGADLVSAAGFRDGLEQAIVPKALQDAKVSDSRLAILHVNHAAVLPVAI
jgi:hypothetical protein